MKPLRPPRLRLCQSSRRVGVIGFSYTCFHALYALTHDPHLFAAAAITDGNEMSYTQYIFREPEIQDCSTTPQPCQAIRPKNDRNRTSPAKSSASRARDGNRR